MTTNNNPKIAYMEQAARFHEGRRIPGGRKPKFQFRTVGSACSFMRDVLTQFTDDHDPVVIHRLPNTELEVTINMNERAA